MCALATLISADQNAHQPKGGENELAILFGGSPSRLLARPGLEPVTYKSRHRQHRAFQTTKPQPRDSYGEKLHNPTNLLYTHP